MINMYQNVSAELYDIFFGDSKQDAEFYRFFIERKGGKALELGCGTGRLLISYLQEGLQIEGLDNSRSMLDRCRSKAKKLSLEPILYEQSMENLDVSTRYATIFIPFCSFMHIATFEQARSSLHRFYDHLLPGGQLLISLYLPWRNLENHEQGTWRVRQRHTLPDGSLVVWHEALFFEPWAQRERSLFRYEVFDEHGTLVKQSMEEKRVRWYGKDEMTLLLEQAGFAVTAWYGDYTFESADTYHETLIVHAIRR
jgi:SAM-dependent methyltransferase